MSKKKSMLSIFSARWPVYFFITFTCYKTKKIAQKTKSGMENFKINQYLLGLPFFVRFVLWRKNRRRNSYFILFIASCFCVLVDCFLVFAKFFKKRSERNTVASLKNFSVSDWNFFQHFADNDRARARSG